MIVVWLVVVAKYLRCTKKVFVELLAQVLAHFKETTPKGEFVIVLAGKEKEKKRKDINEDQHSSKYNENR